jgi:hypothetical protein
MMRRLAVLIGAGAAFLALAAVAFAAVNQVSDTATVSQKSRSSSTKAANTSYKNVLKVSRADGTQPNTSPSTDLFLAKQLVLNGKYFKSCAKSAIDGKPSIPASCKAAVVGTGTASSQAGTPGTPAVVNEPLTVKAMNGPRGNSIFLVVNGTAPVAIQNRVIEGKVTRASGMFGRKVTFRIPPDLQSQLGLQIALTGFNVTIGTKTVSVKGSRITYIQVKNCPSSHKLANRITLHFNNGENVTSDSTYTCK